MRVTCLALVLTFAANAVYADGLFFKLPKDGTWTTYEGSLTVKAAGGTIQRKLLVRTASVGQVEESGQACRWIEVTVKGKGDSKDSDSVPKDVIKLLVPEKYLVQGETPQDHVIRVWEQIGNGKPAKAKGPWPFFLGPPKESKQLEETEVDSKLGKLMCEGMVGNIQLKTSDGRLVRTRMETRLHPDAPFGVVSTSWTATHISTDKVNLGAETGISEMKLKLIDFGDKAKSDIPDAR